MKLYYCPRTRAFTSLWMLEETGAPYTLERVDIRAAGHPSDAYRSINPMGKVAALEAGGLGFGETAAILLYLADVFPKAGLAPALDDPRRGRFLQWIMFPATTLEPVMMERMRGTTPNSLQSGWGDYDRALNALEAAFSPGPWLFGEDFTAADLYISSSLAFGMNFNMIEKRPRFQAIVAQSVQRPAFQRASAIEAREGAA